MYRSGVYIVVVLLSHFVVFIPVEGCSMRSSEEQLKNLKKFLALTSQYCLPYIYARMVTAGIEGALRWIGSHKIYVFSFSPNWTQKLRSVGQCRSLNTLHGVQVHL